VRGRNDHVRPTVAELLHEPRLPDARLTADDDDLRGLVDRPHKGAIELRELVVAADERAAFPRRQRAQSVSVGDELTSP
jgi:hypothetical protein